MASLSLPIPVEQRPPQPTAAGPAEGVVLVAGFGDGVAVDYAAYLRGQGRCRVVTLGDLEEADVVALVLFVGPRLRDPDRAALDALADRAHQRRPDLVCVVGSFRAHLGDPAAVAAEEDALGRFKGLPTVVFRPGHVLSPGSPAAAWLRRFGFFSPLVPKRWRSCCVEGDELFAAIEAERQAPRPGRVYTLLGPNRPWKEWLARHRPGGFVQVVLTFLAALLSFLFAGQLAALVLGFFQRRWPALRGLNFDTLRPRSFRELLALYNRYNYRHVKVVGYNNGVVHFGQKYPNKTVVSTVHCDRIIRVNRSGDQVIKADCGATVRKAMDFLAGSGQELPVLPNYSYVCLGTAFFVPIHGSASDCSTVAETIVKAVLYDPVRDRLIVATRDEPAFRERVYDLQSPMLLLRLYLRVKRKGRYYVHREELDGPDSELIWMALRDDRAANVEVRKARADGRKVSISRYYLDAGWAQSPVLELPRDALGRLWDRLEENLISSFLMHALTRHFGWHVELFFTAEEFATFWATHGALPLRKIQLRSLRRDGLPNSPFRDHDCVSADMFMLRRHRRKFERYLKRTFAVVRANPGKHSG